MTGRRPALGADVDHDQAPDADAIAEAAADAAEAMAEHIARRVAALVVDQLHDLRLDTPAVPLLEHARRAGSWQFRNMLAAIGSHVLEVDGSLHADRIELRLTVDGGRPIWQATLREPDVTPAAECGYRHATP